MFGSKNGWERADYFEPGEPWRRAGADQRAFGWTAPPYLDRLRTEHTAFRERAGIIDMTSFGKIAVEGPGALALLERACCNRIDRPVGAVVYTQMLDAARRHPRPTSPSRGSADDRFRVVSGAGAVDADRGWLEHSRRDGDAPVSIRDVSDELSVIGLWGPAAREILQATTDDDVSGAAFPFRTARDLHVGGAPVLAQRITYVGELGYELYVAPALGRAGLRPAGRGGRSARAGAVRLPLARGSADGEGLPLLRHRPHRRATRPTRPGSPSASTWRRRSRGARRSPPAAPSPPCAGSAPCSSAAASTAPSTAARPCTTTAPSSAGCAAPPTASRSSATWPTRISRSRSRPGDTVGVEIFGELVAAEVVDDVQYDPGNERVRS